MKLDRLMVTDQDVVIYQLTFTGMELVKVDRQAMRTVEPVNQHELSISERLARLSALAAAIEEGQGEARPQNQD